MFLRQSTTQVILFGPCLDIGDGVTEEVALTLAQADMRLSKDGGAFAQKSAAGNATHDSDGWYNTTLSTTDTATVGELILNVHQPANMLPVWKTYWVIEEAVYDAHYGAAAEGPLQGTTAGNTLDVNATGEAGLDLDNTSGTIAAAQIATAAFTAAKFDSNSIDANALATDAVDEIVDQVWNEDATAHQTTGTFGQAIGDPVANTKTLYAALVTDAVGASVTVDVATVQADTDNIQTRIPAALVGGAMDSDVSVIQANVVTASALATDAVDEIKDAILPVTNVAYSNIPVMMVLTSDHITASTGLSLGVTRSIDGGAFGAGTGTAAEISSGMYQYDASQADMNGTLIIFRFTGTSSDDTFVVMRTGG